MKNSEIPKAAFIGDLQALALAYPEDVRRRLGESVSVTGPDLDPTGWREQAEALRETEILLATWGIPQLDAEFLSFAPRLKAVFYAAGTVKWFATEEAYARGIVISSAWEANAIPVAEYACSVILLSLKRFWQYARNYRQTKDSARTLPVAGCYRSTIGLVSLGAVGRRVAEILSRHEVDLIIYDPCISPDDAKKYGATLASLEEVFSRSDVVSIHAPLLPTTEKLVNGPLLGSMKPGATIINTSRGAVIDEAGLCEVLSGRPDLTAILDVTAPEPPVEDSPLYSLENVVLTPHIAGSMGGEVSRMGVWMAEELVRFLAGEPLKHQVLQEMLTKMA